MYLGLFKIRILNRRGRGYQLKPPVVIVRGQHGDSFLHFITLKQMNQKIKAPGQHIKADQLRLEGLNGKKSTGAQRHLLANLNANAFLDGQSLG